MFKIVRDQDYNWIVQILSPNNMIIEQHVFGTSRAAANYIRLMMEWVEN